MNLLLLERFNLKLYEYYFLNKQNGISLSQYKELVHELSKYEKILPDIKKNKKIEIVLKKILYLIDNDYYTKLIETFGNNINTFDLFFSKISKENSQRIDCVYIDEKATDILLGYSFKNIIIDELVLDLNPNIIIDTINTLKNNNLIINMLTLPKINHNSWKDIECERIHGSITIKTNLYLELNRLCNAKCDFCRNNGLDSVTHDFNLQLKNLEYIYPYLSNIYIGGGEPTLQKEKLKLIKQFIAHQEYITNSYLDLYIYTNGTSKYILNEIDESHVNSQYFFSRHSIDDKENAKIFGVNYQEMISNDELKSITNKEKVIISLTCFKNGVDDTKKLYEYIYFYLNIGFTNILISNLHKETYTEKSALKWNKLNIEDSIFIDLEEILIKEGFDASIPIYSTGGYISYTFKKKLYNQEIKITLKKYITYNELKNSFSKAIKRSFDLSMNPKGEIFENWNQKSSKVNILKLKDRQLN